MRSLKKTTHDGGRVMAATPVKQGLTKTLLICAAMLALISQIACVNVDNHFSNDQNQNVNNPGNNNGGGNNGNNNGGGVPDPAVFIAQSATQVEAGKSVNMTVMVTPENASVTWPSNTANTASYTTSGGSAIYSPVFSPPQTEGVHSFTVTATANQRSASNTATFTVYFAEPASSGTTAGTGGTPNTSTGAGEKVPLVVHFDIPVGTELNQEPEWEIWNNLNEVNQMSLFTVLIASANQPDNRKVLASANQPGVKVVAAEIDDRVTIASTGDCGTVEDRNFTVDTVNRRITATANFVAGSTTGNCYVTAAVRNRNNELVRSGHITVTIGESVIAEPVVTMMPKSVSDLPEGQTWTFTAVVTRDARQTVTAPTWAVTGDCGEITPVSGTFDTIYTATFTATKAGTCTVRASVPGVKTTTVSDTATVAVIQAQENTISVEAQASGDLTVGQTRRFIAIVARAPGQSATAPTWTVSPSGCGQIAAVSGGTSTTIYSADFTAPQNPGVCEVHATIPGVKANTTVSNKATVNVVAVQIGENTISVTPKTGDPLNVGAERTFTATVNRAAGQNVIKPTWTVIGDCGDIEEDNGASTNVYTATFTATKAGVCEVRASIPGVILATVSDTATVVVQTAQIGVNTISVEPKTVPALDMEDMQTFVATVTRAAGQDVIAPTWSLAPSDCGVITSNTVNSTTYTANLTAKKTGTCVVRATIPGVMVNTTVSDTATVTIVDNREPEIEIVSDDDPLEMVVGGQKTITADVLIHSGQTGNVVWTSGCGTFDPISEPVSPITGTITTTFTATLEAGNCKVRATVESSTGKTAYAEIDVIVGPAPPIPPDSISISTDKTPINDRGWYIIEVCTEAEEGYGPDGDIAHCPPGDSEITFTAEILSEDGDTLFMPVEWMVVYADGVDEGEDCKADIDFTANDVNNSATFKAIKPGTTCKVIASAGDPGEEVYSEETTIRVSLIQTAEAIAEPFFMGCTGTYDDGDIKDERLPDTSCPLPSALLAETPRRIEADEFGDFRIGIFVVTQGLWETVMGDDSLPYNNGSVIDPDLCYVNENDYNDESPWNCSTPKNPINPVTYVAPLVDIPAFLRELNYREGFWECDDPTDADACKDNGAATENGWRLPSEVEWEYAARGGQSVDGVGADERTFLYSGSHDLLSVAWYGGENEWPCHPAWGFCDLPNGNVEPFYTAMGFTPIFPLQPVGGLLPNALGVYDMSGNVMEFTGRMMGGIPVLRGGSVAAGPVSFQLLRVSAISTNSEGHWNTGFRIVRSVNVDDD